MARGKDWAGNTRQEQADMGKRIITVMASEVEDASGKKVKVREFLGLPAEELSNLSVLWDKANSALEAAKLAGRGDSNASGAVKDAFPPFMAQMRRVKNGWIHVPPATPEIMRLSGLSEPDRTPNRYGEPSGRIAAEVVKREQAALSFRFTYVGGDPADPANKSRRLWYKVVPSGEKPPESPDELIKSVPANRVTETLKLDYTDSGKHVFVAVQLENGDFKGQWGPMISLIIP